MPTFPHGCIGRQRCRSLAGDEPERGKKARGMACRKQMFGIGSFGVLNLTSGLLSAGHCAAVAASIGFCAGGVRNVHDCSRRVKVKQCGCSSDAENIANN